MKVESSFYLLVSLTEECPHLLDDSDRPRNEINRSVNILSVVKNRPEIQ